MISLDGLNLDDPAGRWKLNDDTNLKTFAGRVAADMSIPGSDGTSPSLRSSALPSAFPIGLTLRGPSRTDSDSNLELLFGVIGQRHKLLTLADTARNREALVEVISSAEPNRGAGLRRRIKLICQIPSVFWRSPSSSDTTVPVTATSVTSVLGFLAGSTGPINDSLIRVRGGLTGLVITDPVSGDSLTVTAPLTTSEYLVIDCAKWTARKVATDTWSGGTDVSQYVVSNRGMGPMLTLNPDFTTGAGRIRLTVRGTNPTGSPAVTVRAKSSYL